MAVVMPPPLGATPPAKASVSVASILKLGGDTLATNLVAWGLFEVFNTLLGPLVDGESPEQEILNQLDDIQSKISYISSQLSKLNLTVEQQTLITAAGELSATYDTLVANLVEGQGDPEKILAQLVGFANTQMNNTRIIDNIGIFKQELLSSDSTMGGLFKGYITTLMASREWVSFYFAARLFALQYSSYIEKGLICLTVIKCLKDNKILFEPTDSDPGMNASNTIENLNQIDVYVTQATQIWEEVEAEYRKWVPARVEDLARVFLEDGSLVVNLQSGLFPTKWVSIGKFPVEISGETSYAYFLLADTDYADQFIFAARNADALNNLDDPESPSFPLIEFVCQRLPVAGQDSVPFGLLGVNSTGMTTRSGNIITIDFSGPFSDVPVDQQVGLAFFLYATPDGGFRPVIAPATPEGYMGASVDGFGIGPNYTVSTTSILNGGNRAYAAVEVGALDPNDPGQIIFLNSIDKTAS